MPTPARWTTASQGMRSGTPHTASHPAASSAAHRGARAQGEGHQCRRKVRRGKEDQGRYWQPLQELVLLASSNRGRRDDWFVTLSQTGGRTWRCLVPETPQGQSSPGDDSLSPHLTQAKAGLAAAPGSEAGKLQRHFTSQALVRNGRKAPHLPNTHARVHTPPLMPSLSEQPEKAACYRRTSPVKNKAGKRQSS